MHNFLVKLQKWLLVLIGIPAFCLVVFGQAHQVFAATVVQDTNNGFLSATITFSGSGSVVCGVNLTTNISNPNPFYSVIHAFNSPLQISNSAGFASSDLASGDYVVFIANPYTGNCLTDVRGESVYFTVSGGSIVQSSTHFISVTPTASTTVATSTSIGADVYISPSDYQSGMYLDLAFNNQTVANAGGSALDAWNAAFGGNGNSGGAIQFPLSSGDNNLATTTVFPFIGVTTGTYRVITPSWASNIPFLGSLFSGNTLIASSTTFTVVQPTGLDIALARGGQSLVSALITGTTTEPVLDCNIGSSFSLENCLISLVLPSNTVLGNDASQVKGIFSTKAPFGWVVRIMTLMTSNGTTSLPVLSYTFQSDSPLAGQTYAFDVSSYMTQGAAVVNAAQSDIAGHPETVWQIMEPIVDTFIYLVLLFGMIHDISGLPLVHHKK